jgi:TP901 family phage tail tape measure protein
MSTIVQIQVNVNDAKAIASLTNIENIGKRLSSTPIEIKVNAGAVDKVSKSVIQLAKEQTKQATASAKQAAAEAKVQVAQEKTKQTSNRLAAQQEKTAQSANRLATGQTKAASATQKAGTEAQKTSALTDLLGDSLGRIVAKQAAWQLIGNGIAAVKNSFVEALSTMKEVDSELATVRKVTGMTKDEMDALGESAYSTASKYGVAANEYLQNVSTFARAGYKEAAQGLGELAIKTQLVGDTDQETASQFLLSADAAWKYHGNVEKLSLALDEANTIDNNYATSIQKIAEGLPIVANVASMAGMSMEETMAMLGTITATTQESGTKAATAARALILNILGDTTTEISDGVTATEESVQSLSGILQKYAPDVVAAAEATGKLINPMEAIEALSKAAKDGLISEADLMQMVSALGGKLRTNQLLALLENFGMYKNMLADMGVAAGSADQEVSVMLDTWDAKANILKNTWTEFVSNMVDTSLIKGALDVITGLVKVLDSDFGHLVITATTAATAAALLGKAFTSIKGSAFISTLIGMTKSTADFKAGWSLLTEGLRANPFPVVTAAIVALIATLKLAIDATERAYDEIIDRGKEAKSEAANISELYSEYTAAAKAVDGTAEADKRLAQASKSLAEALGVERGEVDGLADSYENLTLSKLESLADEASASVIAAEGKLTDPALNGGGILGDMPSGLLAALSKETGEIATTAEQYVAVYEKLSAIRSQMLKDGAKLTEIGGKTFRYDQIEKAITSLKPRVEDYNNALANQQDILDLIEEKSTDTSDSVAGSFEEAKNSVDAATEALQRYNAELDGLADKEANANAMQTAFNNAMKDFQAGKVSSAYVKSFYDQFIPDDIKQQFGYSVADAMEWAMSDSNLGKIFNSGDMFGAFQDVIKEAAQSGSLDGIVSVDEDGIITAISSYKQLAEQLGITEGMAQALAQGLSVYMDGIFYTGEEAADIVSQLGDKLGENSHSLSDYASALSQITGQTTVEGLLSVFEGLERAGAINWADKLGVGSAEEARSEIISTIQALLGETDDAKAKIEDPVSFDIDAETKEANSKLAQLNEQKKTASEPTDIPVTVSGDGEAKQQLDDINQAKEDASGSVETDVDSSGAAEAASDLRDVGDAAKEIPDSKQIHVAVRDNASGVLYGIKSRIDAIKSKTVTITTIERKYKGTANGGLVPTNASGTQNAPGGRALVNDGAPVNGSSAELIVDKGDAYIANDGKMAIVDLSPGAKVYTAKQTQDMLSDEKEEIPMHAGGTGLGKPGNGGVYGGDYSGGTGVGGSTASNTEDDDPLKKEISEKLDNLDKQIELARNQNDRAKEQALQQQAAELVKDFVQQYLDKGYSNTSNEVLDLLNRGYGYSDDLMAELVDSLEALTDSTNAANKLAEKQQAVEKARQELENTKKQRTVRIYNPVTGQWEWVAKADDILKAQENLAEAEKDYQDAKIEQELDAIKNGNIGDIGDLTMSPALREVIANASDEEQKRIADILHAISGGAKNTTDTTGESIFRSTDSHDVYYQFGDLKLSETEAKNMTVKELAEKLKTLKLT